MIPFFIKICQKTFELILFTLYTLSLHAYLTIPILPILQRFQIIGKLDYDLNNYERREKFNEYDFILCEKCNDTLSGYLYCVHCYHKETDEGERNRIKYGKCKGCSQACIEHNWCSSCGFQNNYNIKKQIVFMTTDYD